MSEQLPVPQPVKCIDGIERTDTPEQAEERLRHPNARAHPDKFRSNGLSYKLLTSTRKGRPNAINREVREALMVAFRLIGRRNLEKLKFIQTSKIWTRVKKLDDEGEPLKDPLTGKFIYERDEDGEIKRVETWRYSHEERLDAKAQQDVIEHVMEYYPDADDELVAYFLELHRLKPNVLGTIAGRLLPTQITGADGGPIRAQINSKEALIAEFERLGLSIPPELQAKQVYAVIEPPAKQIEHAKPDAE